MGLSLEFWVHSVSPLPLGGFSLNFGWMFTSVGQCAEPITQPCRLKVKVTVEGHEFEPWIWCRLHITFTPGRIFFKPWSNVCLSEMMYRSHLSYADSRSRSQLKVISLSLEFWGRSIAIQTALLNLGQMFTLVRWCEEPITQWCRLKVKVTIEGHSSLSVVRSTSPEPFERFSWNFGQMFALVRQCAEPITQACRLKVKVTVKGHEFEPWISCSLNISWTFERYLLNLGQMFALVRWCAEPITQQCRLKVKVIIEDHQFEPYILRPLHCHSAAGDIAVLQTALFANNAFLKAQKNVTILAEEQWTT